MNVREELEAAIETAIELGAIEVVEGAIALLDELDGDPDFELNETPPLMG